MDLRTQLRFDADPATVFAMLVDEQYIARKTAAAKALRHEVSVVRDGDRVTVNLLRVMPPDVPDFARRFVGDTIDVKQTDVWEPAAADGSRSGVMELEMAGAPVKCRGTLRLSGANGASVLAIDATAKASIPLFGAKIEQAVCDGLTEAAKIEEAVGRAWLAERG